MDEVDGIIINSLNSIGVDIDPEITSAVQFTPELLIESVVKCLKILNPEENNDLPKSLPPSMAQQFRVGSAIASAITSAGFRGEIGYQTLLYPNEIAVRHLLMFLVEKLPRTENTTSLQIEESLSPVDNLRAKAANVLANQLTNMLWLPPYAQLKKRNVRRRFRTSGVQTELSGSQYYATILEMGSGLNANERLLPTEFNSEDDKQSFIKRIRDGLVRESTDVKPVASDNAQRLLKGSRFTRTEELQFSRKDDSQLQEQQTADDVKETRRREIESLEKQISELEENVESIKFKTTELEEKRLQLVNDMLTLREDLKNNQSQIAAREKTLGLLPTAPESMKKLNVLIEGSPDRERNLETQWDEVRSPLEAKMEQLKLGYKEVAVEAQSRRKQMESNRNLLSEISSSVKEKDELIKRLNNEVSHLKSNQNRSMYTQKIVDLTSNIRKQHNDIDKILVDTRALQREIQNLKGRVERSFIDADEIIFRDARRDDMAKRAYKLLATMHEYFAIIVKGLEEMGTLTKESRDLEDLIEVESKAKTVLNLKKILDDYKEIRQENASLTKRIRKSAAK